LFDGTPPAEAPRSTPTALTCLAGNSAESSLAVAARRSSSRATRTTSAPWERSFLARDLPIPERLRGETEEVEVEKERQRHREPSQDEIKKIDSYRC